MVSALFLTAGYLAVWIAFSIAATRLQWALDRADLLTGQIAICSAVAAGWLVIAVGLYQLIALKQACLRRCRSCADRRPQTGPQGAHLWTAQGARYGISCFGCCGVLMGLLLVGGVMNVFWMAAIATGVLAEKVLPWGGGLAVLPAPGSSAGEHFARGRGYLSKRPRGHHSRACRSRKVGFAPLSLAREPSKASGQFQARGPERSRPKAGTSRPNSLQARFRSSSSV
jgi:hypothetical protein